ncbi:hypothetical protein EVAR_66040_1 [Eumeta japonica]|uniref:Uncharacterized protein n=1 Tax=Eumeta variegata TaxID=151549 RepID=A0A4C2A0M7_EUMVA|nr:hypothetical protein EVAR_66040_1 [Eumeta japonica]
MMQSRSSSVLKSISLALEGTGFDRDHGRIDQSANSLNFSTSRRRSRTNPICDVKIVRGYAVAELSPELSVPESYPCFAKERRLIGNSSGSSSSPSYKTWLLHTQKSMTHCRVPSQPSVRARARNERSLFHSIVRRVRVEERQRLHTTFT